MSRGGDGATTRNRATGLRVGICDHRRVVRESLCTLLGAIPQVTHVFCAPDLPEAVRLARSLGVDVLICNLDVADGWEADAEYVETVRHAAIEVPLLAVLSENDSERAAGAYLLGAAGCVDAEATPEALVTAIRAAAEGRLVLPPAIAAAVLGIVRDRHRGRQRREALLEQLTRREREVLELLAGGLTRQEIAEQLHVSRHTVRTHLGNAMRKLDVSNQIAAVALVRRRVNRITTD